jgi:hypothetical protein
MTQQAEGVAAAVDIGAQIIKALRAIFVFAVISAFAIGAFITRTNMLVGEMGRDVEELRVMFVEDVNLRLRDLEKSVAVGVLPDAKRGIEKLEERVRRLEKERK